MTQERRLVDGTRLELVASALRTLPERRVISLMRQYIADVSPANVPTTHSRAKPHSSAVSCDPDGHKSGHIDSGTYGASAAHLSAVRLSLN
jgi:hypothetical protein